MSNSKLMNNKGKPGVHILPWALSGHLGRWEGINKLFSHEYWLCDIVFSQAYCCLITYSVEEELGEEQEGEEQLQEQEPDWVG